MDVSCRVTEAMVTSAEEASKETDALLYDKLCDEVARRFQKTF